MFEQLVDADYKQHLEITEMQEIIKLLVARERQKKQMDLKAKSEKEVEKSEVSKIKLHNEQTKLTQKNEEPQETEWRPEFTFESGDKYTGSWVKGSKTKQGHGVLVWADGSRYEGQFKQNKINGTGKVTFFNGDWYEGGFVDGKKTGHGKYVFVDGRNYNGAWLNDMQHGQGTFTYLDGSVCTGMWSENQFQA